MNMGNQGKTNVWIQIWGLVSPYLASLVDGLIRGWIGRKTDKK